jgi:hypothetical protein
VPEPITPPIATWNPARGAWLDPTTYLCGHSAPYSATLPTSGMTRRGSLFPLPTSAPPTAGPGCSSSPGQLIPTPLQADAGPRGRTTGYGLRDWSRGLLGTTRTSSGNGVGQYEDSGRGTRGRLEAQVDQLLKTPNANLSTNGGSQHPDKRKEGRHGPTLADEVEHLLPTPLVNNSKSARTMTSGGQRQGGGHSGPPGLDETAQLLAGQRPANLPPADSLPERTRALVEHLLPTPQASDDRAGAESTAARPSGAKGTTNLAGALLPTPTATDAKGSRGSTRDGVPYSPTSGTTLTDATERLLPNPKATDGTKGGPGQRGSSGDLMLPSAVQLMIPTGGDHTAPSSDDGRLF